MGEEREHSRFTLVTAGRRQVARGGVPVATEVVGAGPRGAARHRPAPGAEPLAGGGGAACPAASPVSNAAGRARSCSARTSRSGRRCGCEPCTLAEPPAPGPALTPAAVARLADHSGAPQAPHAPPTDRRGEGFAGVAGDLLTSGERVLVAVADVLRRGARTGGDGGRARRVGRWRWPRGRALASTGRRWPPASTHLVALDPPAAGRTGRSAAGSGAQWAHLAWGPAEAEFALAAWGAELDLRPALYGDLPRAPRAPSVRPPRLQQLESRPARGRPLPPQRPGLRPPRPRADRAGADRTRHRRQNLPRPRHRPERPRALGHLQRQPRTTGRSGARVGRAAAAHAAKQPPPAEPGSLSRSMRRGRDGRRRAGGSSRSRIPRPTWTDLPRGPAPTRAGRAGGSAARAAGSRGRVARRALRPARPGGSAVVLHGSRSRHASVAAQRQVCDRCGGNPATFATHLER